MPADAHDLQRVRELLPWFAADALVGDERRFVADWLARHGASHPDLVAELAWLQRTTAQARDAALERLPAADAGLDRLMDRIATGRRPAPRRAAWAARAGAWLARWVTRWPMRWPVRWLVPPPLVAGSLALLLVVQAGVIGVLVTRSPAEQQPMAGPSAPAPPQSAVLTVAWQAQARESDIRALLGHIGAQVIGGPTALGLYRLAVPRERADDALAELRTATAIVESVQLEP